MSEFAKYVITEAAIDEISTMIERIEQKADHIKKMCRRRSHFHACEIRAHVFDFGDMAKNIREYIADQIADQVQYTLSERGLAMYERAKENNDFVYVQPYGNGEYTILTAEEWEETEKE